MRRAIFHLPALAAALALAACGDSAQDAPSEAATQAATETGSAAGTEPSWEDPAAPEGIAVSDARMTLPAVSGNPGAVYFTITNNGTTDQVLRSAWVAGSDTAMMHETVTQGGRTRMRDAADVPVPAGESVAFAPGGLHVMAMNVGETLEVGGETEVTLTFASGDKVSFPARIRAPGDSGVASGAQ